MTGRWNIQYGMKMAAVILLATQFIAQGAFAQTTDDGLEKIDGRFQALYWRSGKTLDQYKRIVLLDCLVQFRKGWLDDENRGKRTAQVTEEDMAKISETLSSQFRQVFTEVFEEDGEYEFVNVAAPDVLILRPAVLNFDAGWNVYNSRSAAQSSALNMTLYLEFFDSATNTLIGRALEKRADPSANRATVGRTIRRWAEFTRDTIKDGPEG